VPPPAFAMAHSREVIPYAGDATLRLAFRFCLLQQNFPAVLLSVFKADFRDEVSFRHFSSFPEGKGISFR
jgi:hypothetical protein